MRPSLPFLLLLLAFIQQGIGFAAGPHGVDNGWAVDDNGTILLTSSRATQMAQAETGWIRIEFRLVNGHATWNNSMFTYYDTVVNNARSAGLQVIALIDYTSWPGSQVDWCANNFETTGGNGDNAFIGNLVTNALAPIVQHFQDRVQVYELWNEQSTWDSHPSAAVYVGASFVYPSNYSWMLNRAWTAIHKTLNLTNVTLVSGGIFGTSAAGESDPYGNSGSKYLEDLYKIGTNAAVGSFSATLTNYGLHPFDAVGQHLYVDAFRLTTTNSFRSYLDLVHNIVTKYEGTNSTKKTFLTEFGWTTSAVSQSAQAANLLTAFRTIEITPYVQTAIWFSWQDGPTLNFGILDINGSNKLAYPNYKLSEQFQGRNSNGLTNSSIHGYFNFLGQAALGNPYNRGNGPYAYGTNNRFIQDFDGGSHLKLAVFSSTNGTFEVNNLQSFWDFYLSNNGTNNLGFPTNNAFTFAGSIRQDFEKASLGWDATNGVLLHGPSLPPATLTATLGNARVILNWPSTAGAWRYNVKRATSAGGPYVTIASGVNSTGYTNTTFVPGVAYHYVVSSTNWFGESTNSVEAVATPTNGLPDVVVTSVSLSPTNPVAGTPVTFKATVTNQGSAPTPAGVVLGVGFSVDSGISYTWSGSFTSPLAPGSAVTLTADGGAAGTSTWTSTAGSHNVIANVDDVNRFEEVNESNNLLGTNFNVFQQRSAINSGGGASGTFAADTSFNGGNVYSVGNAINTSAVSNAAPQSVYQSERWGTFSYAITNLMPGALHAVRLHFAEIFFDVPGQRSFNVSINGNQALTNFDILADAGSKFKATAKQFNAIADANGRIAISFLPVVDNPKCSGLEVTFIAAPTNTPPVLTAIGNMMVNSGRTFTFTNTASDVDIPPQILSFSLDAGAPAGASVGASDGVFAWSAPVITSPQTNTVTVRVADNGSPSLNSAKSFTVIVIPPPRFSGINFSGVGIQLNWETYPGKTYRVQYKNSINGPNWLTIGSDILASGFNRTTTGNPTNSPQKFYRIVQLD